MDRRDGPAGSRSEASADRDGGGGVPASGAIRALVADDQTLFRKGLTYILRELGPEVDIVEASTFGEMQAISKDDKPFHLVLLDLRLPGMAETHGFELLASHFPGTPIVIVSAIDDRKNVIAALEGGAAGYLPKTLSSGVILSALRLVLAGGVFVPHSILLQAGNHNGDNPRQTERRRMERSRGLTPRQLEVLRLLSRGNANKEIARQLDLSVGTVKLHVTALLKALNVRNRTQAVIKAAAVGILEKDESIWR